MVALIDGILDEETGEIFFEVVKPIELETIVSNDQMASRIITYSVGAKVFGIPAQIKMTDPRTKQVFAQQEGVLIEQDGGHILMPFENVAEVDEKGVKAEDLVTDEDVKEVENVLNKLNKTLSQGNVMGFNYKQLLLMGVIALVVVKVIKE